jgi:hypothetical protein
VKTWIAGALGVCAGALMVLGYDAMDSGASRQPDLKSPAPARISHSPSAPSVPRPPQSLGQLAEPTGPPAPARHGDSSSEAAPPPDLPEKPPLPPYLQKHLESDPPGIAQLHSELAHEARDPTWAPAAEYQMQQALQEAAPELLGRIELYQTTCGSSICEMVGAINDADLASTNKDMQDWQQLLQQAPALSSWKATGLGPPSGMMFMDGPEGHPVFVVEFRKAPVGNKSPASRSRLTRA